MFRYKQNRQVKRSHTLLKSQSCYMGLLCVIAIFAYSVFELEPVKADEFGCNFTLCDSSNPCNRGCTCTYPEGATVGYCKPWYKSEKSESQEQPVKTAAKSYKCSCDSPCSGSITCATGCYAFCEENPEGSGRHVCIKGCSTASLDKVPTQRFSQTTKLTSAYINAPKYYVAPMLERLFGSHIISEKEGTAKATLIKVHATPEKRVRVELNNTDIDGILCEVNKKPDPSSKE